MVKLINPQAPLGRAPGKKKLVKIMAANHDRTCGILLMLVSTALFAFFTMWVIIMPMVDADHPLQQFFPDRYYGLLIPFLIGAIFLTITTSFIGIVLAQSQEKFHDTGL